MMEQIKTQTQFNEFFLPLYIDMLKRGLDKSDSRFLEEQRCGLCMQRQPYFKMVAVITRPKEKSFIPFSICYECCEEYKKDLAGAMKLASINVLDHLGLEG